MKTKKRIYIDQWLDFKPYRQHSPTDRYYLALSNQVHAVLWESRFQLMPLLQDNDDLLKDLSCFLTAYFEDLISGTNLWTTFVQLHKEMYGKLLPFYDATEEENYFTGEINEQDLCLLMWYYLNLQDEDYFLTPYLQPLFDIAAELMPLFEEEWETAPENETLKAYYLLPTDSDYYAVRAFIDRLLFKSYLFFPDTGTKLIIEAIEQIQEYRNRPELQPMANDLRDRHLHGAYTRLLSLRGKEWAAALLGRAHPLYEPILNLSERAQGLFLYKGQDATHISLEHIATGRKFSLYKPSFEHARDLQQPDTLVFISLVQWQHEWWFSGVYFQREYDAETVAEERNNFPAKQALAFLDQLTPAVAEALEKQRKAFLDFNEGSPIAFMKNSELQEFNRRFVEFYNNWLHLSEQERQEAQERGKKEGFDLEQSLEKQPDFSEAPEDALFFFNPKVGGELVFGLNSAFPDPRNPFYQEAQSKEDVQQLLISKNASPELARYCLEHYGNQLPYFQQDPGKSYLQDLDFLLRFWKVEDYHSEPAITLSGGVA